MHISRSAFDRLVEAAIAALPEEFANWLERVPVIVEDRPGKADRDGTHAGEDDPVGLYTGSSIEDEPSGMLPPRIMLYRIPLMDACATREQLAEEIRKTLFHELGHHAGMDEDQLNALGYGDIEEEDEDIEWDVDEEK